MLPVSPPWSSSVGSPGLTVTKTWDIPRVRCDRSEIGATCTSHIVESLRIPFGSWSKNRPLKLDPVSASCRPDTSEALGISCTIWMTSSTGVPITRACEKPDKVQNALLTCTIANGGVGIVMILHYIWFIQKRDK
jgi:hypothetical protein